MQDYLTGLRSASAFLTDLEELLAMRVCFAVVAIDLVNFRSVNDMYGLPNGDRVIVAIAQSICNFSMSYRIGGTRFAVVVQRANEQASLTARSIREKIESLKLFSGTDYPELRLNVRIGLGMYPEDARNLDDLLKFAHDAMFADKPATR